MSRNVIYSSIIASYFPDLCVKNLAKLQRTPYKVSRLISDLPMASLALLIIEVCLTIYCTHEDGCVQIKCFKAESYLVISNTEHTELTERWDHRKRLYHFRLILHPVFRAFRAFRVRNHQCPVKLFYDFEVVKTVLHTNTSQQPYIHLINIM